MARRVRMSPRLKRNLRRLKAGADKTHRVQVGFLEPHIAALAAVHEFGRGNVPPRPAFASSLEEAGKAAFAEAAKQMASNRHGLFQLTRQGAQAAGEAGAVVIRHSFSGGFTGEPLGERQEARKRGTRGAGLLLVGVRGAKLASHVEVRVTVRGL